MLIAAINLQVPITAICATQQMDISIRDITLTLEDWSMLKGLKDFFLIFVSLSQKMQDMQRTVSIHSTIGLAYITALMKLDEYYTLTTNQ
jgi:hypothetical protein